MNSQKLFVYFKTSNHVNKFTNKWLNYKLHKRNNSLYLTHPGVSVLYIFIINNIKIIFETITSLPQVIKNLRNTCVVTSLKNYKHMY